jgi:hypothetical protein
MRVCRIKLDRVPDEQRPQRDADRTEQKTEWEEDSKGLCETQRERFSGIHRAALRIRRARFGSNLLSLET